MHCPPLLYLRLGVQGAWTILGGDSSVLSHKRSREAASPEFRSDPQQPQPWSQSTGSLALAFRCQLPNDRRQRAPSAGSGPLQNTRTGQAPTQVRATASTLPRKVTEGHCCGEDCRAAPTACQPRTHHFWTNLSAPSPPRAPSGPRAARGRAPRWNGGGRERGSPRKSRVITWPQTDVILKRTGWPAKVPGYSYTEHVPFSPLREDMLPAERWAALTQLPRGRAPPQCSETAQGLFAFLCSLLNLIPASFRPSSEMTRRLPHCRPQGDILTTHGGSLCRSLSQPLGTRHV